MKTIQFGKVRVFASITLLFFSAAISLPSFASIGGFDVQESFESASLATPGPILWTQQSGSWEIVNSAAFGNKALHLVNAGVDSSRAITAQLQGESLSGPVTASLRYSRKDDAVNDGNISFTFKFLNDDGNGYIVRNRAYAYAFKFEVTKIDDGVSTKLSGNGIAGVKDLGNHLYTIKLTADGNNLSFSVVDDTAKTSVANWSTAAAGIAGGERFDRVVIEERKEQAGYYFDDLSVQRLPFKNLQLVKELDLGGTLDSSIYEENGTVSVQSVLGSNVRAGTKGQAGWFGFRLGDPSTVSVNQPYLLELVVPEDTPRGWIVMAMDSRDRDQPGSHLAFQTGIYNVESAGQQFDYNILPSKLRQRFVSYWAVVWPAVSSHKSGDRLWVYCINKADDPRNNGMAIKTARLYSASVDDMVDPEVDAMRQRSPRRLMWSTEAVQNTIASDVAKARIAGANTFAFNLMPWNNSSGNARNYMGYRKVFKDYLQGSTQPLAGLLPSAQAQGMSVVARLEYGGSPAVYAFDDFEDKNLRDWADSFKWTPVSGTWNTVTSPTTQKQALAMVNNGETKASFIESRLPIENIKFGQLYNTVMRGPVTMRVDYSRAAATSNNAVSLFAKLLDDNSNGYMLRVRPASSGFQYEIVGTQNGISTSIKLAAGTGDLANHVYSLSLTVGDNRGILVLNDKTAKTTKTLIDTTDARFGMTDGFTRIQLGQQDGFDDYYFEEVAVGRKGAAAVTTRGTEYVNEKVRVGGHLGGYYNHMNIIIDPAHPHERGAAVVDDLAGLIDDVVVAAGPYVSQLTGIYLRNRVGRLAPSFSDDDIAQYESETGNTVTGATYADKRATLDAELKFPYGADGFSVGASWKHAYMQWWYKKLGIFLETVRTRIDNDCGCRLDLYYHHRSGEGFMGKKPDTAASEWLNDAEWGLSSAFIDQLTDVRYFAVTTQPWTAGNTAYLNPKIPKSGAAILVEPGYIEYAWDTFKYSKAAPSWEPGTKEYASQIELLATAYGDPMVLSREAFASISRGFPSEWADYARQFYSLPAGKGTTVDLRLPSIVATKYSTGEIAIYNVGQDETTIDVSSTWPALKEVRSGRSLTPAKIHLRAFSMIVARP